MPLLTIEKDELRETELTAKLDGVALPVISSIKIISNCGEMTRVEITCIVATTKNGDGVLIKESALKG